MVAASSVLGQCQPRPWARSTEKCAGVVWSLSVFGKKHFHSPWNAGEKRDCELWKQQKSKRKEKQIEEIMRDWWEAEVNCREYLNNLLSSSGKMLLSQHLCNLSILFLIQAAYALFHAAEVIFLLPVWQYALLKLLLNFFSGLASSAMLKDMLLCNAKFLLYLDFKSAKIHNRP